MDLNQENDLRTLTDEKLVDLYREGRDDVFELMVDRYRQELFHFLVGFLRNRATAEDIFQETFLKVFQALDSFDTTRRFKPWLFTIAANKARDELRRNGLRRVPQLTARGADDSDQKIEYLDIVAPDLSSPNQQVEREETEQRVKEAVDQLPDHLREILLLAYFHRFPYKQIAEILAVPQGTVKSRLHAAVAAFAQIWTQHYEPKP